MDTRLLPAWQAREEATIDAKFRGMIETPVETPPVEQPPPTKVDVPEAEGWMQDFLRTTGADISDVLLRGASFGLLKPSDFGALGKIVDAYKTPDERKTALRKWAEFGLIELPTGMLSPLGRLLAPVGRAATKLISGAGTVAKGAVSGAAQMGAIGAGQQVGEEIRSEPSAEGMLPKVGRVAMAGGAGVVFGAALGAGAAKIEQVVARRSAPKATIASMKTADDAEVAAWDAYATARPGEISTTATAEMDAAEKAAWDVLVKEAESAGKTPPTVPPRRVFEGKPSSLERKPIAALSAPSEAPPAPPQLSARDILKKADEWEGMKEGMGQRTRLVADERITQLRQQAKERAAVEIAEQTVSGLKDPEVRQAVQSAIDSGLLVLPEGMGRDLGPAGRANLALTSLLARTAIGALTGAAIGETPEERTTNALVLAGGAAILSPRLFRAVASKLGGILAPVEKSISSMSVKQGRRILSLRNLSAEEVGQMATIDPTTVEIPNNRGLSVKYGEVTGLDDVEGLVKRIYSVMGETGSGAVHMTDDQLWKAATSVGLDIGELLARKPGDPTNRIQLAGAIALHQSLRGEMTHLLSLARSGADLTPEMLHRLSIGSAVSNVVQGGLNEGGAMLRLGHIVAQASSAGQIQTLADISKAFGGPGAMTFDGPIPASAIKDMIAQAQQKNVLPSWFANLHKDLIGSWINSMLSSGVSFARNAVGTSVMFPFKVAERRLAEVGGHVAPGEAAEMLWSVPETLRDAVRIAINSWEGRPAMTVAKGAMGAGIGITQGDTWNERLQNAAVLGAIGAFSTVRFPEFGATKLESSGMRKLWNPQNYNIDAESFFGRGLTLLGDLMQTPGDALRQADNLLKMVNYRAQSKALSLRKTWQTPGLDTPAKFDAELAKNIDNPSQDIMEASRAFAEKNTFTQELGKFGTMLANTIDHNIIAKIMVPFFRTTVNIAKEFLEIAPGVAQLNSANWKAMLAGGAERDLAIAKQALGVMLALPAFYFADKGYLMGDLPKHQGTATIANNLGAQAYAFRFPSGNTMGFNGLAPMGWFFGMAADIVQMMKHADERTTPMVIEFAKAYILALAKNVAAQSYLQSVGNATQAFLDEDGHKLQRYLQMQSRSIVPRLAANWAAQDDQVRYEIHSLKDAVYSQLPGFSRTVKPLRDPFGDIVYRYGAVGPDSASFLFFRPGVKEPGKQAVLDNDIRISRPPKTLFGVGEPSVWFPETNRLKIGIPMTDEQYDRYAELSGNSAKDRKGMGLKDRVDAYAISEKYKTDSRARREAVILGMVREHRAMADNQMLKEFPELGIQKRQLEQARAAALRPGANEAAILQSLGR